MNKQQLSERIVAIQKDMEVTKANYAKLEGHLNECSHWLKTLLAFEEAQLKPKVEEVNDAATMDGLEQDKEQCDEEGK